MYSLTFYHTDGEREYRYGMFSHVEYAFREPRLYGLSWTMDGDGWTSGPAILDEAEWIGAWYITRED